jgi:two-component system, chemotaxis family, sensor kinase CheA
MAKKEEFLKRLRATFAIEAEEHLQALTAGLLELEQTSEDEVRKEIVERVFREAHSLKGAARAVDMADIEAISHALESVLAVMKRGEMAPTAGLLETLHRAVDALGKLLTAPEEVAVMEWVERLARVEAGEVDEITEEGEVRSREDVPPTSHGEEEGRIPPATSQEAAVPVEPVEEPLAPVESPAAVGESTGADAEEVLEEEKAAEGPASVETIRISTAHLDALLRQVEEMTSARLAAEQHVVDLQEVRGLMEEWKKAWGRVAPEMRRVRQPLDGKGEGNGGWQGTPLSRVLGFLEWNQEHLEGLDSRLAKLETAAMQDRRAVGGMVDEVLDDMKQVLTQPFSTFAASFPRMVRDLAREQGKEVELSLQGSQVEIDRRILEALKDPFVHLLRNAVDHGIEKPEERERIGKSGRGTVTVSLSQVSGNRVEVLVADDGAGIDAAAVRAAAVRHGMIDAEEAEGLSEGEALALIFRSDLSTSRIITDISGRGLGLAIVREKVENLGGTIAIETEPGKGTGFRMLLPLSLATFRTILVHSGGRPFAIPTGKVERAVRILREEIRTVENRETVPLDGAAVPLVPLADVLELPQPEGQAEEDPVYVQTLVMGAGEERIAFGVDAVVNEQVVLIKGLGRQLVRVRNVAGATVLGSGQVVPILNVLDLLKSAVRVQGKSGRAATQKSQTRADNILVVEDSITSRTLLKNILEVAGYQVTTAVDGVEGFTALREGAFDLVVSDVEMPRMDGFELTEEIRGDERLGELPVVLVTSLESREHRERGIDVGANAYIVKSSFDQSNLLETVGRLI